MWEDLDAPHRYGRVGVQAAGQEPLRILLLLDLPPSMGEDASYADKFKADMEVKGDSDGSVYRMRRCG